MKDLIAVLITLSTFYIVIINFTIIDNRMKYFIFWIVPMSLIMTMSILILPVGIGEPISGIIMIIGFVVMLTYIKRTLYNSIVVVLSSMLLCIIVDSIYGYLLSIFLPSFYDNIIVGSKLYYLFGITFGIIVICCSYVVSKILHKYIESNKVNNRLFQFIGISFGLIVFTSIYYIIFVVDYNRTFNFMILGGFIISFIFFIVLLYLIYTSSMKEEKMIIKQLEFEQLESYTSNLEVIFNDIRKIRHDYMNVLASMIGYMNDRNMDGLVSYFNKNVIEFTDQMKNFDLQLGLLSNVTQSELKGLISLKIAQAQEYGLQVDIDIIEAIEFKEISAIDLCRSVGILLDNALEATKEIKNSRIQLGLIEKEFTRMIIVENTCQDNLPAIYKLYEKGFSTKGEKRGIGLSNLREIMNKYDNCSLETIVKNSVFTQIIEISKG